VRAVRVRVERTGSQQCRIVGKSQSVLMMINPIIIFTRTRICVHPARAHSCCRPGRRLRSSGGVERGVGRICAGELLRRTLAARRVLRRQHPRCLQLHHGGDRLRPRPFHQHGATLDAHRATGGNTRSPNAVASQPASQPAALKVAKHRRCVRSLLRPLSFSVRRRGGWQEPLKMEFGIVEEQVPHPGVQLYDTPPSHK
jgi:hypothetical protein